MQDCKAKSFSHIILTVSKTEDTSKAIDRLIEDFTLRKQIYPDLICVLLQLESQLGGDYSEISKGVLFGSPSTHVLLSHFDVDLHIITLLEGERKVDEPIHKPQYFKELKRASVLKAVEIFKSLLRRKT